MYISKDRIITKDTQEKHFKESKNKLEDGYSFRHLNESKHFTQ